MSTADVQVERARQLELALKTDLTMQQRLDDIAYPLLQSAALFCGAAAQPRTGIRLGNVSQYSAEWAGAARALGYTDTLQIFHVPPGSAAARAGLQPGDRIMSIGADAVPLGRGATTLAGSLIQKSVGASRPTAMQVTRATGGSASVSVAADTVCAYDVVIERSGALNAYADGRRIVVTTAMLRYVSDDELAMAVAHEIAHNAMRHLDAKQRNSALGALFGAVVDIAAAANGYDTQGTFRKSGAEAGSIAFSQDFEREADYVGLYILALSGRPLGDAATLWRRMATEAPLSIQFASTHPTSAERFVRIERWRGEIEAKLAAGKPLIPESRNGRIRVNPQIAAVPRHPTSTSAQTLAARGQSVPSATRSDSATGEVRLSAAPAGSTGSGRGSELVSRPTAAQASAAALAAATLASSSDAVGSFGPADPRFARVIIGAPSSDSARDAAVRVFEEGLRHARRGDWPRARVSYERALRLDGSIAQYHAARGQAVEALGEYADAEASYSAALLLDPGNPDYTAALDAVRVRRRNQR